jgi:hypothetical protein
MFHFKLQEFILLYKKWIDLLCLQKRNLQATEHDLQSVLGRPRRRWVDNIKIDLGEIGWDGGGWIDLAQDKDQWRALVKAIMNLRVP